MYSDSNEMSVNIVAHFLGGKCGILSCFQFIRLRHYIRISEYSKFENKIKLNFISENGIWIQVISKKRRYLEKKNIFSSVTKTNRQHWECVGNMHFITYCKSRHALLQRYSYRWTLENCMIE